MANNLVAAGTVEDFVVKINSPTSASIYWKPPPRTNWNGPIESYIIISERGPPNTRDAKKKREIETIMVTPLANHHDPSLAIEPLKTESFTLESLEENFEYQFSIITVNSKGAGSQTEPTIQTMPESGIYNNW